VSANTPASDAAALPPRPDPPLARTIAVQGRTNELWALAGGLLACGLAVMTTASAVSNLVLGAPFPADHELMKHFIAVVIFMFLPYCQLVGANVTVDIFTERMSEGTKALMGAFSAVFAICFALLLLRQMWFGMWGYVKWLEVTPVLGLPLWTAFPPILASLFLLLIAAIITLIDGYRAARGQVPFTHRTPFQIAE